MLGLIKMVDVIQFNNTTFDGDGFLVNISRIEAQFIISSLVYQLANTESGVSPAAFTGRGFKESDIKDSVYDTKDVAYFTISVVEEERAVCEKVVYAER